MKKILLLFYMCSAVNIALAQDVLDKLQGTWLCDSITNELGGPSEGSYGKSGRYLALHFKKKELIIIKSPYSARNIECNISMLDANHILILPPNVKVVLKDPKNKKVGSEFSYEVIDFGEGSVKLKMEKIDGGLVFYSLKREKNTGIKQISDSVDLGYIMIRNMLDTSINFLYKTSEFGVANSVKYNSDIPKFDYGTKTFADFLEDNITIPNIPSFQKYEPDEYLLEFDVTSEGVKNINVVGVDKEMIAGISKTVSKSSKRWKPDGDSGADYKVRLTFHLFFLRS